MQVEEMAARCYDGTLTLEQIDAACLLAKISRRTFFDELANWLAVEFLGGRQEFTFCDGVASNMMPISTWDLSDFSWSVFHAFDSGEFYHRGDPRDIDPVEKYTRPLLRQALAERN